MSTIQANAILDASGGNTATVNGITPLSNSARFGRNLIINGGFDVWQRGTSFSNVNNTYTADRMLVVPGGGTTGDNVTRQAFTVGQTDVPGEPTYFFRFTAGSTSSNKVVHHRIEDVRTGAGQTVTLSFWGKASTAHNSSIELGQNFGSGGSSGVAVAAQSYSLTTSWQKFTFNVTLPSISGKTIGTSSYVAVAFIRSLPASNVDIDIAQMQLEIGSVATTFENRSYGEELALCQRYFCRDLRNSIGNVGTASSAVFHTNFPVTMRDVPTITNTATGQIDLFGVGTVNATTFTVSGIFVNGARFWFGGMSGSTFGMPCHLLNDVVTAESEL